MNAGRVVASDRDIFTGGRRGVRVAGITAKNPKELLKQLFSNKETMGLAMAAFAEMPDDVKLALKDLVAKKKLSHAEALRNAEAVFVNRL